MKIIIAPDKFKGSLSSVEVCAAIARGIEKAIPGAVIERFPMADGGDGFASVMGYYLGTTTITCATIDPLGRHIDASYQWDMLQQVAIIEIAAASGLVLLGEGERDAAKSSSFGTGIMMRDAITRGAKKIILGLGGSATNDAGTGILGALGFYFTDEDGNNLVPCGGNLHRIHSIVVPAKIPALSIDIACDVQNPLHGPHGAAYIYAAQKGASAADIQLLDTGLAHFAQIIATTTGKHIANIPGTGAAGGIAAGLLPFFDVSMASGTGLMIAASGIKNELHKTNLLVTGEGKLDEQTLDGKVVAIIAQLAREANIPAMVFCGRVKSKEKIQAVLKLWDIQSLVSEGMTTVQAIANATQLLEAKAKAYFKSYQQNK